MPSRAWILVIAAAAVVASFGAGYAIAGGNSNDYAIYTGDCYAGEPGGELHCRRRDLWRL